MTRILLINSNHEDYMADALLHGLRILLGDDVVDFPRADYMYDTLSDAARARIRGGGFTLYGLLPDTGIDRDHILWRALDHEFDLVIFGDLWNSFGLWTEWGPMLTRKGVPLVVIDGADRVEPYPFAGYWWRTPAWWFLPRAHTRARYFKREITPWTSWFASYLMLPPGLGRGLGLERISFAIPEEKIVEVPPDKDKDFPSHVVDPEVAARIGGQGGHVFSTEEKYYADLGRSRFGITTKREGWDALRHYEIAAQGTVPCFRDLDRKPATCAPHGLDRSNCVIYRDADDLFAQIAAIDDERYEALQAGALRWIRDSTTVVRARQLLRSCGLDVAAERPREQPLS